MKAGRFLATACGVAFLAFGVHDVAAQAIPIQFGQVHTVPLVPEGSGAWVLRVVSRGGFHGRGAGDFTLTSDRVNLASLDDAIRQAPRWDWGRSALSNVCSDCYSTLLVLTWRDEAGTLRTNVAFWDPATRTKIAKEVTRLHDLAVRLQR